MKKRLDIVGHFGTTFSYGSVGSHVARAIRDAGFLGHVSNLDPTWHESFADLRDYVPRSAGTHVLLFTPPAHYLDLYPEQYGRQNAAVFMSPNTDRLAVEYAETCVKFGLAIVPSRWCERVTYESCRAAVGAALSPRAEDLVPEIRRLPLGVNPRLAQKHITNLMVRQKIPEDQPLRALHFSTDQFLPGRKGTEELLSAWRLLDKEGRRGAQLTLHVPEALHQTVLYLVRERDLSGSVTIVEAPTHGSDADSLMQLFDAHDLVIAPSRCEGFGLMLLSALVAGVPLVCTAQTGQYDFLRNMAGWLGVPTVEWAPLLGEEGEAPVVDARMLAQALRVALAPGALGSIAASVAQDRARSSLQGGQLGTWLWPVVLRQWVATLGEWMEEV